MENAKQTSTNYFIALNDLPGKEIIEGVISEIPHRAQAISERKTLTIFYPRREDLNR